VMAVLDGRFGFGQSIGEQAVDLGIDKARQNRVSIIALRNSGHLGRIGDWAERAAAQDQISVHFVNTSGRGLLVAPFGAVEKRMSTNPFAVGVPRPGQAVADFPEPFRGQVLRGWPFEVSSSAIRERLRLGQAIDGLVPSAVAESLKNDNPYKSEQ